MSFDFTQTLESSRILLALLQEHGDDSFTLELSRVAESVRIKAGGEIELMNGRFLTLISGILSILYVQDLNRVIRSTVVISQRFLSEPVPEQKRDMFVEDLAAHVRQVRACDPARGFSERVVFFLRTCPLEQLRTMGTQQLADRFHLSRNYFADKFNRERGQTIHDVLTEEKLNRALLLLRNPDAHFRVKDLARMLGFSDPIHFSNVFKERFGAAPSEIRKS